MTRPVAAATTCEGDRMRGMGWRAAVCVALVAVVGGTARAADGKLIARVTISDTPYTVVDVRDVIARAPQPMVRTIVTLSRFCAATGAYGFYAGGEVGVVAYAPRSVEDCVDRNGGVVGGGPGGSSVCTLAYRSPRAYVFIVANTTRLC